MGNGGRSALDTPHTRIPGALISHTPTAAWAPSVHVLRGRPTVVAMRPMLAELSRRTGQTGAMDSLDYFLGMPEARRKTPYLLLVGLRAGVQPEQAQAGDVQGALLLHEYRVALWGAKVFATDDRTGRRTVIAPPEMRTRMAEIACRTLIAKGAVTVLISLEGDEQAQRNVPSPTAQPTCWMATRTRIVPGYLPLGETLDQTLATMGRHTRRNLRYYRRRLQAEFGARFVPRVEIGLEVFLQVNRLSMNPISDQAAAARYKGMGKISNALFAGVQSGDGRWLSLIGGRRHEGTTEIDWQMNSAGLPRSSVSTVMRSYLLEHEIQMGTAKLVFEHGTPHSMRHSFVTSTAVDILVRRRSVREWALRRFADRIFPEKNFLRDTLGDRDLIWTRW